MKKPFIILLSAIVLVASLGVTGAFADSGSSPLTLSFDSVPVFSQIQRQGIVVFENTVSTSSEFVPLFNDVSVRVNETSSNWNVLFLQNSNYSSTAVIPKSYNLAIQFDNYGQWYTGYYSGGNFTSILNRQTGFTLEGLATLSDSSFVWSGSTVGEWVNFSIKPGYAFVIEGECEILERSYYINNSWSFFGTNNGHRTNGSSERISAIGNIRDGFSVDYGLTRDQLIQWEAQNPNLVGSASIYEFYNSDLISLSSGSAFFVSYPLYDGVQTTLEGLRSRENSVDFIGSVYLNYTTRPTFRYVALKSNIDANNKDVAFYNTLQPSITDSSGDVTETPDGTTISPGDIPSGGGDSSTPPLDEDNSLLGTISKFVNDIKRLLSTAVESINTLVSEGSQFMRSVAQMFTWLPEQLTSLLVAAFTILVVVGVLKVLWR